MVGCTVYVTGTQVGTVTDLDGYYTMELPHDAISLTFSFTGYDTNTLPIQGEQLNVQMSADNAVLEEVVVVGYAQSAKLGDRVAGAVRVIGENLKRQQKSGPTPVPTQTQRRATTVAFAIERPYSIPTDGKPRSVEIKQYQVVATYRYLAVPKISNDVFLSAIVNDWEQYDMISGNLQLFFEGTYLGSSFLDVDKTADSLQLSLGRDAGVVITRELDEDFRKSNGLFGGRQMESRGWNISVRNTKAQSIDLAVLDQVPVSAQGNIDVDLELPKEDSLDENSGQVSWQFKVPASTERKLSFGYRVKYPVGERVVVE